MDYNVSFLGGNVVIVGGEVVNSWGAFSSPNSRILI